MVILDACLATITALVFANLLIVGIKSFVAIRTIMALAAGLMAGALAALVRDMSPRLTRALAFGLLTMLAVAARYGWAAWMKVSLSAMVLYGLAMLFSGRSSTPVLAPAEIGPG